jgi:formylglycine-generating enzyme required for sulfatase activity
MRVSLILGALAMAASAPAQTADFQKDIQPILEKSCLMCHGASAAAGDLRLHERSAAMKAIVPGQPQASKLYTSLELPPNQRGAMPPGGPQLPKEQREAIRQWIAAGAPWPEGLMIGASKVAKAADDEALAARLHKRISAATKETKAAEMKAYTEKIPGTDVSFDMVPIPGGEFVMGTPETERGRRKNEGPQRKVKIDPFWMGKHEVTWDEYRLFMFSQQAGEVPGKDQDVDAVSRPTRPYVEMSFGMGLNGFPAISMTQHAANKFAQWLSARTGHFYRLPTEAEWEYACRAGTTTAYSFGDDPSQLGEYAWYADNSSDKYQQVGKKKPNPWGLHDMHGNVMEWTLDQLLPYASKPSENPWVKATKPYPHAVRGGSWTDDASQLRCGARVGSDPTWKIQDPQLPKSIWYHTDAQGLGLRLVRPLKVPPPQEMFQYWNSGVEQEE